MYLYFCFMKVSKILLFLKFTKKALLQKNSKLHSKNQFNHRIILKSILIF